jgi:hypothetical protein
LRPPPAALAGGSPVGRARQSSGPVWRDPEVFLRRDFLPKVLGVVPIDRVMSDPLRRPAFLELCDQLVSWTVERLNPPWQIGKEDRYDRQESELLEWRAQLYHLLAHVALHMDQEKVRLRFLEAEFALNDDLAASLIAPFVDTLVCTVMDAPVIDSRALMLIHACLERALKHRDWSRAGKK